MAANITNVFVLMLENRSFDCMLGFSGIRGRNAADGTPTTINGLTGDETNGFAGQTYQVGHPALEVMPVDPGHEFLDVVKQLGGEGATYPPGGPYPTIHNSGFVADYAVSPSTADDEGNAPDDFGEIMKCYAPDQLPVLNALANEFVVCDRWHASIPGPTWPNRFFACAASSAGLDHSPTKDEIIAWESREGFAFPHGSIFDALRGKFGNDGWRIYAGTETPNVAALKGIHPFLDIHHFDGFAAAVQSANYPWRFTFIEPNYGNLTTFKGGTSQHPMDDVTAGEGLIKATYEAIRNSPHWPTSLLIITWDEHGGFYDHAEPPPAPPPGDQPGAAHNQYGFMFDRYGVRVPAMVISPLIPRNLIDHRLYDHSSIPKTVEDLFGLNPLTARDAAANSLVPLLTATARTDAPTALPSPATAAIPLIAQSAVPASTHPMDKSLPGVVNVAMLSDNALNHAAQPEIVARVQSLQTRGRGSGVCPSGSSQGASR